MLNKIIYYSLHNRVIVVVAAMLLFVAGIYVSMRSEVDVFPDLNAPTVVVMTEANGMAAEEVEQLVTFPIETAVNGATYVRRVRSSSTNGFSIVWVEFEWDTDIYLARQIVSEKLSEVAERLPAGVGQPTLGPQSSILGELMIIGMTADSTSMLDLRTLADWTVRPRLLSTGGVAQVAVIGGDIEEYQIELDPGLMEHYGVTLDDVLTATRGMNLNVNGGVLYENGNEYIVRGTLAEVDAARMAEAVVKNTGGSPVMLSDISDIKVGGREPKLGTASEKGKPAVLVTVTKQPNANTLQLTEKIDEAVKELQKNMPADVKLSTDTFRQSRFIESSIHNVKQSLYEGALFVVVILFLFLANIRTTFISIVTLPLSLLITIITLDLMGLTLNTMSLGGMAIAIGSLVDDAIVDVENVFRRLRENRQLPESERKPMLQIVHDASCEVRRPILNSTLIIMVSFLPLFFLSGMEGKMLVPLGIAFIVSLFASTVVALTLTPVLCSYLLGGSRHGKVVKDSPVSIWLKAKYKVMLERALRHRRPIIGATVVMLCAAIVTTFFFGSSFLPPFNEGSLTINVSSLPGISLAESDSIGRRAESILMDIPEITTVARKTGRAELDEHALGVNTSEIEAPFELKDRSRDEFMSDVRQRLSTLNGALVEIGQPISHRMDAMLSGTKASIAIKIFGDDLDRLFAIGNEVKARVSDVQGIADLNVEQQIQRPQLRIVPKRAMLAKYGITLPRFAEFVNVALAGEKVSQVYRDGKSFDIVVKVRHGMKDTMEKIRDLKIDAGDKKIPLSYIADIKSSMGPNTINRENVKRKVVVSANTAGRDVGSVVADIQSRLESLSLPKDYHIEYGGQFESEQNASRILMLTSLVAIALIFMLLYFDFKSFKQAATVLVNLPLALIGGVFAIAVTSGEISIPAIIGFISLFGIATRNGMLLISHYNYLADNTTMSLHDRIMTGSLDRLNPILMTALSSGLALIPLAINGTLPGNEIQSPMAKVILGGLLTSTLLNAFIVPIVYELTHKKGDNK